MKNTLFKDKFTNANQYSYYAGWDKAVKTYQEVMVEVIKEKLGLKDSKNMELIAEEKKS
ncbi:MAG: hypothetical protein HC880_17060 [Bacteroidia bacterium]|nr:hypothetical protein [Bacteroidia bacterium]